MKLRAEGNKVYAISKITGINRSCVNNWINRGPPNYISQPPYISNLEPISLLRSLSKDISDIKRFSLYSYILGFYLGDGTISRLPRTKGLMLFFDKKYQPLIDYTAECMASLLGRRPHYYDRSINKEQAFRAESITLRIYNKNLDVLFPQYGPGKKHLRKIELTDWQKDIINHVELVRGLMMSDGCYYFCNTFKKYKYTFTNCSSDIINVLSASLSILNIRYCIHTKRNVHKVCLINGKSVINKTATMHLDINRKEDVERLYRLIGDKSNIIPLAL